MLPNLNLFLRQTKSDLCSFSVNLSIIYNLNVSISFKRKEDLTEPKVVNGLIFVLYFWCFSLHCTSGSDVTCQKKLLMLCSPVAAIGAYISPTCFSLQENLVYLHFRSCKNYFWFHPERFTLQKWDWGWTSVLQGGIKKVGKTYKYPAGGVVNKSWCYQLPSMRIDTTTQTWFLSSLVIQWTSKGWDRTELDSATSQGTWISSSEYQQWPAAGVPLHWREATAASKGALLHFPSGEVITQCLLPWGKLVVYVWSTQYMVLSKFLLVPRVFLLLTSSEAQADYSYRSLPSPPGWWKRLRGSWR